MKIFMSALRTFPHSALRIKTNLSSSDYLLQLEDEIMKYNTAQGKVIICGDLNSRTGTELDFINVSSNQFDLTSLLSPSSNSGHYFARNSRDQGNLNTNGNKWIRLCKEFDPRVLNGRCLGDSVGEYTCFNWDGYSVVDNCITSNESGTAEREGRGNMCPPNLIILIF